LAELNKQEELRRHLERAERQAELAASESELQAWLTIAASYRALLGYPERPQSQPETKRNPFGNDNEPE
jgi:hypothetical protein